MESSKEIQIGGIVSFFREHPVLIVSLSILLCSCVGYWSEYRLMQSFGINIVVFAEADDFLLAAFKNPSIFAFSFPVFAMGIMIVWYQLRKLSIINTRLRYEELDIRKEFEGRISASELEQRVVSGKASFLARHHYNRGLIGAALAAVIVSGILAMFLLVHIETDKQLERIRSNPSHYSVLELRTNRVLLPEESENLVLITATEKYVFFYLKTENQQGETVVVPTASIASMFQIPTGVGNKRAIYREVINSGTEKFENPNLDSVLRAIENLIGSKVNLPAEEITILTAANLNLRSGPSRDHQIIYVLKEQTEIEVLNVDNIWFFVKDLKTGDKGWVHSRYVKSIVKDRLTSGSR
ncbi:SH3 domain-containing protein [Pseudoalteromonas sp. PPB1]|uniref:SH3 domain-containing protein n=1 Tax=Pseudoalteromonas sp. PPB1 TaxID=2756136 RepID=UPI001891E655|nr:SH3 domain-containing protein [Pseudoalteromonas sp. PPB1]